LVGKTFYIVEDSGYDTIATFYLQDEKLKLFYVIFYHGQLDETATLDASINNNGYLVYTVFDRPTALRLIQITDTAYIVKEYHGETPNHTLVLQFSKPGEFAK